MSSNAPFRLAIVGAGLISREAHLPAALKSRHVELVALVDPVVARARELAADFGIRPQVAADVAEVLGKIDGAVIAAPNKAHHPIAKTCLAAGKHVLIEKPMTTTVAEADDLLAAARASGASIAVGYVTRFRNSTRLLAELLANSYFGKVHEFYHQFGSAGGWAPLSGYNLTATAAGGGVLVVTGTHFLDRMLALWGYPDELTRQSSAG